MKDQYFGDFGDYQKFSLLKLLRDTGGFKITVHWMKTKNDGGTDGKHITYLNDPATWNSYDKEIYDFLKHHVGRKKRNLALFEESAHASAINFIHDHIEDPQKRLKVLDKLSRDKSSNLIFFDPDNGIEVKSTNSKNVHKYVLWRDIEIAYASGKSILIYQHFSRKNREVFVQEKLQEIKSHLKVNVFAVKVKHSVYFLLAQEKHKAKIKKSLATYKSTWRDLVSVSS